MHHADSSGDTPGSRKMAHSSVFPGRRGSNTGGSNLSALTTTASMSCNVITADDHQSPLIMQHVPPSGSSSPGPHHPPHSLNINAQPQSLQSAGAQVKKKSGFQITSVLPAQVSASANNSIADDTESYDDMDESHTEDLSSSDILDVSVSRATDRGVPERSSSEETLNSLHGVETPGITSPNEPVLHHTHPQASQQGYLVNGTVHPHPQHHHGAPQEQALHSAAAPPQVTPQSGRAAGAPAALASVGTAAEAITQPAAAQLSQTPRASQARAAAPEVSAAGAVTQPVSATMTSGGGTGMTGGAAGSGFNAAGGGLASTAGPTTSTPAGAAVKAQPPPPANTSASSTQAPMAAGSTATASRFRVVKLDSSSEPFRKGRWTCTEYYEKEAAQAPPPLDAPPAHRVVEGLAQLEGDNSSGSSGSSTLSGSGGTFQSPGTEGGAQPGPQVYAPALAGAPLAQPPLQQPAQQYHPHPQEAVAPPSQPAMVPPTSLQPAPLTGLEAQASTARPQTPYTLEQPGSVNQGSIQTGDFSQPLQGTIAPGHQLPPASGGAMTRGAPGIVGVAGSSAGGPAAVPQVVSPRPTQAQPPASQIGLVPGGGVAQLQQILQEKPQANTQPLPPASVTSRQTVPSMLQGHLQPDLSRAAATLLHGGGTVGHAGVLGLALGHPGALQGQLPSGAELHAGAGMGAFTASQLEDAHRLLFQHQNLLGFPKLAAAGVAGLAGQSASIAGAASGQEGGAGMDASALLTAVGTEEDSSSGASVVAIDNKIEQAMDLVKSHLMYAVREEVEVLKEQIKELIERNSQLEQENNLLKNLASPEQLAQFQAQVQIGSPTSGTAQLGMLNGPPGAPQSLPPSQQGMGPTA